MAQNKHGSHKGKSRQFSTVEEIRLQLEQMNKIDSDSDSDSSQLFDESKPLKPKGVQSLISEDEIENPNLNSKVLPEGEVILSRREREQLKQMGKECPKLIVNDYESLEQIDDESVKKDLARLLEIRKQREEARQKREIELKEKERKQEIAKARASAIHKKLEQKLKSPKKRSQIIIKD